MEVTDFSTETRGSFMDETGFSGEARGSFVKKTVGFREEVKDFSNLIFD